MRSGLPPFAVAVDFRSLSIMMQNSSNVMSPEPSVSTRTKASLASSHLAEKVDVAQTDFASRVERMEQKSEADATLRFAKTFPGAVAVGGAEVCILTQNCALGGRPGKLWVTYRHICFHSSILGFTKKKVYALADVQAVWRVRRVASRPPKTGLAWPGI